MSAKRKRVVLTLKDKLDALARLDNGVSVSEIANNLGVGNSTVKDWKKNRKELEAASLQSSTLAGLSSRRTLKKPVLEVLDEALWFWFIQEKRRGNPISGPILKENALVLHKWLEPDVHFSASEGWLNRWKKRHGVHQHVISGEKLSTGESATPCLINDLNILIKNHGLTSEQLYKAEEACLNYKMLPRKTLAHNHVQGAPGFKERLTISVCSNKAGTHKLPPFVIGQSKNPRAFKNINPSTLPVHYRAQKSAWMAPDLLEEWFKNEFVPLVTSHLQAINLPAKAILVLDNAPSHSSVEVLRLGEIKAYILPPNVTALVQPMVQEVIESLKIRYRKKLLNSLFEKLDSTSENQGCVIDALKQINIKDVVYMISRAWVEIPASTLTKSWSKILPDTGLQSEDSNLEEEILQDMLTKLNRLEGDDKSEESEVRDWINVDCELDNDVMNHDAIIDAITQKPESDKSSDDEDNETNVFPKISHATAKNYIDRLLQYVEQQESATAVDTLFFRKWRDYAAKKQLHLKATKNE